MTSSTDYYYIIPFSGENSQDCLHVDTSALQNVFTKELKNLNAKTLDFTTCVNSEAPEFFNDCLKGDSKVNDGSVPFGSECQRSTKESLTCEFTYRNMFESTNDQQCACPSNIDNFMLWKYDNGDYACIPHQRQINVLAYTPVIFEDYNIVGSQDQTVSIIPQYSFETWFYLQSYTEHGMRGFEFQWTNQLRVTLDQMDGSLNNFQIKCFPRWVKDHVDGRNDAINNQNHSATNFESKWYHIRCSVDIDSGAFVFTSNVHEASEINLAVGNRLDIIDNEANNLKFMVHNQRMLASGRMFIRQLRLWSCYYCHYPMINYRVVMKDVSNHLLMDYFGDKVFNSWDSFALDGEYNTNSDVQFTNDIKNTVNKLTLNKDYYRISFEDKFTLHEINQVNNSNEITYINRKDAFVNNLSEKDPEYLVPLENYYTNRHLTNLRDYEDITSTQINPIPAPIEGRYTVEFFFKFDENLASFDQGINIILSDTISIALLSTYFEDSSPPALLAYCFPNEYKVKIGTTRNAQMRSLYEGALNKGKIETTEYNRQWIHFRCAVSQNDDEFYFQKDGKDSTVNAFNTLESYRRFNDNTNNKGYDSVYTDLLYRKILHPLDKINISINGASSNKENARIYLRNLYFFTEYIPRNIDYSHYEINDLSFLDIPSRVLSIDFSKLDFMRTDTTLEYELEGNRYRVPLPRSDVSLAIKNHYVDYTLEVPSACNLNRAFNVEGNKEQCIKTECNLPLENCRANNTPLTCPAESFLLNDSSDGYVCTRTCHGYLKTDRGKSRHPGTDNTDKGGFCNFTCDGSTYKADSTYTRLSKCDSRMGVSNLITDKQENFLCEKDLNRFGYKCWDDTRADKGKIYFNDCFDFPNMSTTVGDYNDDKEDYTVGFWFKLDNLNDNCTWQANTGKGDDKLYTDKSIKRHIFYSNMHTFYRNNDDNNSIYYEVNGHSNNTKTKIDINPSSWNQITLFVKNKSFVDVNIHVNYKANAVDTSMILEDSNNNPLNLVLTKIGFCDKPDCLEVGDNIHWTAAFYKELFYINKIPVSLELIRDKSFLKKHTLAFYYPLNLLHSDLNNLKTEYRNTYGNSPVEFRLVDNNYTRFEERASILNFNTMFDWEEENLGNVITTENSNDAFITTTCNTPNITEENRDTARIGCARCFDSNRCYRCFNIPGQWKNNYYLENETCIQNVNVYTELPPISGTETAFNFDGISLPLDPISPQIDSSIEFVPFKDLKHFTFTIFIKYKTLIEGICSENSLIKYHDDLYVCYDESSDSLLLTKKNGTIIAQSSNFTEFFRNKWIFFGLSIGVSNDEGIGNMLSFNINQNDLGTRNADKLISPPSTVTSEYLFKVFYKNKSLLYNFRVYSSFILKPYGYVNNFKYDSLNLHYNIPLVTQDVHLIDNPDKLCINENLNGLEYLPKFNCSFDSAYNIYASAECNQSKQSIYSNQGVLECQNCDQKCVHGCTDAYEGNCSYDNETGHAVLVRVPETKNKETQNYITQAKTLEVIELNRYKSATVNNVKRSSSGEYSVDFWMFMNFYNQETRDSYFKTVSFTWDGHLKMELGLIHNADTGQNQVDMNCYIAYNIGKNIEANGLKKEGYLNVPENKWVHLRCGARIRETTGQNKLYFTNLGRNSFILDNYTFVSEPATTSLVYENKSKANFGIFLVANLQLWETFSVETMNLDKCIIRDNKAYLSLLHVYKGSFTKVDPEMEVIDVHKPNSPVISGTFEQQADYIGYGFFKDLLLDFSTDNFRSCINLQIDPYQKQGENSKTPFDISCILDDSQAFRGSIQLKYSVLPDKEKQTTIQTTNGAVQQFVFSIEEPLGLCKDQEVVEVYCIATYNTSPVVTDIVSDNIFLDRQVSSVDSRRRIDELKTQLLGDFNIELYDQIFKDLANEIVGTEVKCDVATNTCSFGIAVNEGGACVCKCPCGKPIGNICVSDAESQEIQEAIDAGYQKFLDDSRGVSNNQSMPSRRRRMQISTSFGKTNLEVLYNIIRTSIDSSTIDYVNKNFLDIMDNLLFNPTQDHIIDLIQSELDLFVKIIDTLSDYYNKRLREKQNAIFYNYLLDNTDSRLVFDASFLKYNSTGSFYRNYTSIYNFEGIREFNDSSYIMTIGFTNLLLEERSKVIRESNGETNFNEFELFYDRIGLYLKNLANITITHFQPTTFTNHTLSYFLSGENFIFDLKSFSKDFDFDSLKTQYNGRSYFDPRDYISSMSSKLFYYYYISFSELPENYNYQITPFSGNLDFRLYDEDRKTLSESNSDNILLKLNIQTQDRISTYLENNKEKYADGYLEKFDSNYTDIIRQPYYVDSDGNIDFDWNWINRINEFQPNFRILINSNSSYYDYIEGNYLRAKVSVPGKYYATSEEVLGNFENYENDYFWSRKEIYTNSDNYKENPSLYVWCVLTALFIGLFIWFYLDKITEVDPNVMLEDMNYYDHDLALNDYLDLDEMYRVSNNSDKKPLQAKATLMFVTTQILELGFFDAWLNLIGTNRFAGLFGRRTIIEPKYKRILNFWFFLNVFYFMYSILLTFTEMDLLKDWTDNKKEVIGYFFAAYGCAFFANLIVVIFTIESRDDKEKLRDDARKNTLNNAALENVNTKNLIKAIILILLNLALSGVLFYSAVGFTAYWKKYKGIMEIAIPIMLIIDFVAFDIVISFIMAILYKCKYNCLFRTLNLLKFPRAL
eukprot:CAMPEP_0170539602 /NCGR_PEP_ID=MMETSP0209-20121228/104046_1 /TAXON_ID=665100 ORGANISM="Litonotus pictus, Strain P1" /NCGR_SAMPLE_ID=MMETSP0209 /ASSEMBLY_ACC=CAM_ASM_000301 /LENGTH=2680 /DNA_ID=CAMNT_0010841607 /DNA_START=3943 /DNA_END=11985 /DNA_ORIENTATION=-